MANTYLAFDKRSGRILGVHHGANDSSHAFAEVQRRLDLQHHKQVSKEDIEVIAVPAGSFERGKRYKVDLGRKALVEASSEAGGVGFGFGVAASSSSKGPTSH